MKKSVKKVFALVLSGVILAGSMTAQASMSGWHCISCQAYYFETGHSFGTCPSDTCNRPCEWYECKNCGRTDVICTAGHIFDY